MPCGKRLRVWEFARRRVPIANGTVDYTCPRVSVCYACESAVRSDEMVHWAQEDHDERKRKKLPQYDSLRTVMQDRKD